MAGGFLFVAKIGEDSALAVLCEPDCDIGFVGYELSLLAVRIGRVLTPAARPAELSEHDDPHLSAVLTPRPWA